MKKDLYKIAASIKPADKVAVKEAALRQESLAKPPGSLGTLEDISIKMAGITGNVKNQIKKSCVMVFCADNGVFDEGVAATPQSVTMAQTINFTRRLTGVGALAESFGSELLVVDMGVKDPIPESLYDEIPLHNTHRIIDRSIRKGTWNIAKGDAMTVEEAIQCINTGIEMAGHVSRAGFDIAGIGEMGIGNTTTSAAVLAAITGKNSECVCGRGAGLHNKDYEIKKRIVDEVSAEYRSRGGLIGEGRGVACGLKFDEERADSMIEILAAMGGFDICAMTGAFIGCAANRLPVVIDGYISAVAALSAAIIAPESIDYMFASHKSFERGYMTAIEAIGLEPFLALGMRLGEGSGCPIAFDVIKGACDVMNNMATFAEAEINDDYIENIKGAEFF